jgi:proteasome accessory factor B
MIREWQIVDFLRRRRFGATVRDLMSEVGASRSTVYRELEVLFKSPLPIDRELRNGEIRYVFRGEWSGSVPTVDQLLALAAARRMLAGLEGTAVVRELDRLLGHKPPPPSAIAVPLDAPLHQPSDVSILEQAITRERRARVMYQGSKDESPRARIVEPVELRRAAGGWYVHAFDVEAGDWRTFKLARVTGAELLADRATSHPVFDPAAEFAYSVGIWSGDEHDVRLRVNALQARFVREYPLNATQENETQLDGSVIVRARVAGLDEVQRWVMRWGRHVEVLDPPELRARVVTELTAMLARYEAASAIAANSIRNK